MEAKETTTSEAAGTQATVKHPAGLSGTHAVIIALVVVIIVLAGFLLNPGTETSGVATASATEVPMAAPAITAASMAAPEPVPDPEPAAAPAAITDSHNGIERKGEGRLFYSTIRIPAGAETLYLSGSGAAMKADGTWGNMEEQAIDTFNKFKATLEAEGWSMADIVQVRAFAVAGDYGLLDFEGFNRGYSRFFGTEENPNKPVRSFVQVADLVVDGWLVEVEVRAARMPE